MNIVKKLLLCCGLFGLQIANLQAQSIYFSFNNGTQQEFLVSEIRTVTFSQDTMHLNKRNGTTISWAVSDIGAYKYSTVTGVQQPLSEFKENNLLLFPNPTTGAVSISYSLSQSGPVSVSLLSTEGQLLREIEEGQRAAGDYTLLWDGKDSKGTSLPNGTYLCRVNAGGTISNKKIVIIK